MITLTDGAVFSIALDADTTEHNVRRMLRGDHVPSKSAARILRALIARGVDIGELPRLGPPALCADDGEQTATGRMSRSDHGPHFFAGRYSSDD